MIRHKVLPVCCVALALTVWTSVPAWTASVHQGKVVAVGAGTLTIRAMAAKNQHTYAVAAEAFITCDGQTCGLTDVRGGDMVTVTTDTQNGKSVATRIAARQADSEAVRPDTVSVGCRPVSLLAHCHGSHAARR
jgi:hypothetical protein